MEHLRLIVKVFTRPVVARMAAGVDSATCLGFLRRGSLKRLTNADRVGEVLDQLWLQLLRHYRSEYVFKSVLANRLIFGRHSPRTASCHIELPVGKSIVDLAVMNGTSTAYEIKTEFDSPYRLKTQTHDYLAAFDRVYVLAPESRAEKYLAAVDRRVGILALTGRGTIASVREAVSNVANVSPGVTFRMMRRAEYVSVVEAQLGRRLSVPNGIIATECRRVFEAFEPIRAHREMVEALRARTTDESTASFIACLPPSLRALGYATPLSRVGRVNLLNLLDQPAASLH